MRAVASAAQMPFLLLMRLPLMSLLSPFRFSFTSVAEFPCSLHRGCRLRLIVINWRVLTAGKRGTVYDLVRFFRIAYPTVRSPNDFVQSRYLDHHPNGGRVGQSKGGSCGEHERRARNPVSASSFVPGANINDERNIPSAHRGDVHAKSLRYLRIRRSPWRGYVLLFPWGRWRPVRTHKFAQTVSALGRGPYNSPCPTYGLGARTGAELQEHALDVRFDRLGEILRLRAILLLENPWLIMTGYPARGP